MYKNIKCLNTFSKAKMKVLPSNLLNSEKIEMNQLFKAITCPIVIYHQYLNSNKTVCFLNSFLLFHAV